MTTRSLTDKQRQALACLEGARSAGVALSAYVRSRGLAVREIYDAIVALRRKGVLPAAEPRSKGRFVAVRVEASAARASRAGAGVEERSEMLCRVLLGGGTVIECCAWPPAGWLAALSAERSGAAT